MSVRFLGRRVYLAVAVVMASAQRARSNAPAAHLALALSVPVRTLERWQGWWQAQFPLTALWRAACGRFMPPVAAADLPGSALERFTGTPAQSMRGFLVFLTPLTIACPVTLQEGR